MGVLDKNKDHGKNKILIDHVFYHDIIVLDDEGLE